MLTRSGLDSPYPAPQTTSAYADISVLMKIVSSRSGVPEASQVGLENLFLLWMAPRVIVVGDDKQCTPGASRMGRLDELFESLSEHLGEIDHEIRHHFTSKTNLYGLLSARSGRDAVVRLREHFRCMPEIINWSSRQFYGEEGMPGLVALRERTASDLEPLKVIFVEGAYTDGRNQARRNPVEAKRIVAQLVECLEDSRYTGKTFGVIVLYGQGQVKLLRDHRNLVHPKKQLVDNYEPEDDTVRIAWNVVVAALNDLASTSATR